MQTLELGSLFYYSEVSETPFNVNVFIALCILAIQIQNPKFFSTFWRPPLASEISADDDFNSNLNLTYWFNVLRAGSFWCWLL